MNNIILLILCFVAGILLRRARLMPDNAPATLNSFIIHISVPALALLYIHELKFSGDTLLVVAMAWLYFGLAAGFFWLAGRYLKLSRSTVGALMRPAAWQYFLRPADDRASRAPGMPSVSD
jgi:predicted permease